MIRRLILLAALLTLAGATPAALTATAEATATGAENRARPLSPPPPTTPVVNPPESPCTHPGSTAEAARIAAGCCGAPKGGSRRLYRAVEPDEGRRSQEQEAGPTLADGSESKYFYGSRSEAAQFARAMNANGFNYNRITSGRFDSGLLGQMQRPL